MLSTNTLCTISTKPFLKVFPSLILAFMVSPKPASKIIFIFAERETHQLPASCLLNVEGDCGMKKSVRYIESFGSLWVVPIIMAPSDLCSTVNSAQRASCSVNTA